jgi:hypothetical protein
MKMSSGNKIASATADMIRSIPFAFTPWPGRHWLCWQPLGGAVAIAVACTALGA